MSLDDLTYSNIYKYGMGMLKLPLDKLERMPLGDFVIQVESQLLWEEEKIEMTRDSNMPFHALNTAFIMQASGNMKKSFDPLKTAEMLYPSENVWGNDKPTASKRDVRSDYDKGKEALQNAFDLDSN